MAIRYEYASEIDDDTLATLDLSSNNPWAHQMQSLKIDAQTISPDNSQWLHCVEAQLRDGMIRLRVITNAEHGINILIPLKSKALYFKYLDLRYQIRNTDRIMITCPALYVKTSTKVSGLIYLMADDFKALDPNKPKIMEI